MPFLLLCDTISDKFIVMRAPLPFLFCCLFTSSAFAQEGDVGFTCKTHDPLLLEQIFGNEPGALAHAEQARATLDNRTEGFVRGRGQAFVIPVVFHVIHQFGSENISDAQIEDAVRILNEDYNKLNPDWPTVRPAFLDLVADVGITFKLAQRDPNGDCTNGITRTVSQLTNEGNYAMTQLIQWPREHYMNVWVGASANGAAGYTNYPWVLDGSPQSDGIVVQASYVGSIGSSSASHSRVLSHEVGHWLNLKHCWGGTNDPGLAENCDTDDDVDDTPLTKGWTFCSLNGASCGSAIDNVENYMEYSYCDKMFTLGQADRMIAALTSSVADRSNLWQPENLAFTGVYDEPTLCAAAFTSDRWQICAGSTINFTDVSFHQVSSRTWEFPGGQPATSTEPTPAVQYNEPGIYPVTLIVGDGTNTLQSTQEIAVEVLPFPGSSIPFSEGFEEIDDLENSEWTTWDPDGDGTFMITGNSAFSGEQSIRLANGSAQYGLKDELISTTFDLSNDSNTTLTFSYAFAKRNSDALDVLRVYVSNTCGTGWSLRKQMYATSTLNTAGVVTGTFTPTASQWQESVVANIGVSQQVGGFRFKFQFEHAGGNDLYLDNINLNSTSVGLSELSANTGDLRIRPNPAHTSAQADIVVEKAGRHTISIMDLLGRPVIGDRVMFLNVGRQTLVLPIEDLAVGSYLLVVRVDNNMRFARFAVGE